MHIIRCKICKQINGQKKKRNSKYEYKIFYKNTLVKQHKSDYKNKMHIQKIIC